jgi:hypothetical protein
MYLVSVDGSETGVPRAELAKSAIATVTFFNKSINILEKTE